MRIGFIDVDGSDFPNLPLMKLSAWHKQQGDIVEWYYPALQIQYDRIYMSKVFTFTPDYDYPLYATEVIRSGTGYFYPYGGEALPEEIERIYPDYSLYPESTKNKAFGFLTRGCPMKCKFCAVWQKEGLVSHKVADLHEFWRNQRYIKLMDPNLLACREHPELLQQLIDCNASVDFSQGLSAKLLTEKNIDQIRRVNVKTVHFAWDNYSDWELIVPKLELFKKITGWDRRKIIVYMLTNYDTTHDQDLERIYKLKEIGCHPDVRIYNKREFVNRNGRLRGDVWERFSVEQIMHFRKCQRLQGWVNNRRIWAKVDTFEQFNRQYE